MFTFEIKINGSLIAHIYGHNEGRYNEEGETEYRYEYYETERPKLTTGTVFHDTEKGIRPLIVEILQDVPLRNDQREEYD